MDEREILSLPSFSSSNPVKVNKERPRKKLWRNAVQVVASDDSSEDSDGHECAFFPAKRHCSTQLSEVNETHNSDKEQHTTANTETTTNNVGNIEYDDIIYQIQIEEKLKLWQAFQEEEGSMDNSVNEVLAYYRMMPPLMHPPLLEEDSVGSRLHLSYRGNDMEDTAVTMAIRNHGLVQSVELAVEPHYYRKRLGVDCSFSSVFKCMYELKDFPYETVYSNVETGRCNALDADKVYECDQPEDFLERAVGEAIKKKGLSALSVDYG
ncbi:uncharacterized protein LOC114946673 [Nylanderia fulva]|uniref:uncharacterized protein LOC114946673 n=1 Tax=Nylanderia fulva TaxID=613905 RepID=UPI0010FAF685|nr:uncharacterized protein LOC114946673 [Nylanderia fulva]